MNIYGSISEIMREGYSIGKEKYNQQQGFKYRGIDDVMNVFQPLLSKHGVFVVPEVLEAQRKERTTKNGNALIYSILTVKYTFYAEDGSSVSAIVVGEGMDSGDKASNKAMAVAMKYAMFQVFCIPTEEMVDPDATTPEPVQPKDDVCKCEHCGAVLKPYKDSAGKNVSVRQHAAGSKKVFGQVLCLDCIKELHPEAVK